MMRTNSRAGRWRWVLALVVLAAAVPAIDRWLQWGARSAAEDALRRQLGDAASARSIESGHWGRRVDVWDARVPQPPGFGGGDMLDVGHASASLQWGAVWRERTLALDEVRLHDVRLRLILDGKGTLNWTSRHGAVAGASLTGESPAPPPAIPFYGLATASWAIPLWWAGGAARVRLLSGDVVIDCEDPSRGQGLTSLVYRAEVAARDLRLGGPTNGAWAAVELRGALAQDPRAAVAELKGLLAPLHDTNSLAFDLSGEIRSLPPDLIRRPSRGMEIECAPFQAAVGLSVRAGQFEPDRSSVTLQLEDIRIRGKLFGLVQVDTKLPSLAIPIAVSGPVTAPAVDMNQALLAAALQALGLGSLRF